MLQQCSVCWGAAICARPLHRPRHEEQSGGLQCIQHYCGPHLAAPLLPALGQDRCGSPQLPRSVTCPDHHRVVFPVQPGCSPAMGPACSRWSQGQRPAPQAQPRPQPGCQRPAAPGHGCQRPAAWTLLSEGRRNFSQSFRAQGGDGGGQGRDRREGAGGWDRSAAPLLLSWHGSAGGWQRGRHKPRG